MVLAGEHERLHDAAAVDRLGDLVGVLLDDGEEVREQVALDLREVLGGVGERSVGVIRAIDRPVPGDRDRAVLGRVGPGRAAGDRRLSVLRGLYAAARIGELVRYRSPSSRRRW